MPRPTRAMGAYKKTKFPAKCRKHPNIDAVRDGKCQSCLAYEGLGRQIHGTGPKKAAPPAAK